MFPQGRHLAVLICSSKIATVLCYLLPSDPSLLKPMSTTNHSVFFFTILPGFVLTPASPPYACNTPSPLSLFLQGGQIGKFIFSSFMLLGCWGDTQRCSPPASRRGTARGNLDLYCRKSLSYCQFGTCSAQLGFPGHLDGKIKYISNEHIKLNFLERLIS